LKDDSYSSCVVKDVIADKSTSVEPGRPGNLLKVVGNHVTTKNPSGAFISEGKDNLSKLTAYIRSCVYCQSYVLEKKSLLFSGQINWSSSSVHSVFGLVCCKSVRNARGEYQTTGNAEPHASDIELRYLASVTILQLFEHAFFRRGSK